ncbi:ADP-ribosylation/crystallin J1 [Lysobacter soli]|uniref:ADP-ribosylation/crystallin J1 n=1 Tax=Lysobacter soli TaxID=453783 RepID=UPI0037C812F6
MNDTVTLYRPTGPEEMALLEAAGFRRWPPRLPEQPIFYPVTNERYAIEIAARWNVKDSGVGYVTRFEVQRDFMERYPVQKVGGAHHTEWWVPAEELDALNDHIVGLIEVVGEYRNDCTSDNP